MKHPRPSAARFHRHAQLEEVMRDGVAYRTANPDGSVSTDAMGGLGLFSNLGLS